MAIYRINNSTDGSMFHVFSSQNIHSVSENKDREKFKKKKHKKESEKEKDEFTNQSRSGSIDIRC